MVGVRIKVLSGEVTAVKFLKKSKKRIGSGMYEGSPVQTSSR
jgi:hypothetical protein